MKLITGPGAYKSKSHKHLLAINGAKNINLQHGFVDEKLLDEFIEFMKTQSIQGYMTENKNDASRALLYAMKQVNPN